MVEWSITAVLKTVELKGSGGSNPSLSAKRMLTHSLFSFWAPPKTASREGLTRQELALVSGKHSLGAGVAKQREKSDKSATHRFARAPRRAGRDVGALARRNPEHFHKFTLAGIISETRFSSRKIGTFVANKLKMSP